MAGRKFARAPFAFDTRGTSSTRRQHPHRECAADGRRDTHASIGTNGEKSSIRYGATLSGFQFQSCAAVADDFLLGRHGLDSPRQRIGGDSVGHILAVWRFTPGRVIHMVRRRERAGGPDKRTSICLNAEGSSTQCRATLPRFQFQFYTAVANDFRGIVLSENVFNLPENKQKHQQH